MKLVGHTNLAAMVATDASALTRGTSSTSSRSSSILKWAQLDREDEIAGSLVHRRHRGQERLKLMTGTSDPTVINPTVVLAIRRLSRRWGVTPALHALLMSVTNAIAGDHGGAIPAAGPGESTSARSSSRWRSGWSRSTPSADSW
jgi:NAD/NADP transhydrogenase alpha subunit